MPQNTALWALPWLNLLQRLEDISAQHRENQQQSQEDMLRTLGKQSIFILHELRGPLQAVFANLQVLQRLLQKEHDHCYDGRMNLIFSELERMDSLLESYFRIGAEKEAQRQPLQLAELCQQTLRLLRSLCIRRQVQAELNAAEKLPPLLADQQQLRQLLLNLTVNSIQAMEQGGRLEITVDQIHGYQRVQVADSGTGIPPALRQEIFRPYFTTKEQGVGLGLPWCAEIARQHGGSLTYTPQEGGGSRFTATFSLTPPPPEPDALRWLDPSPPQPAPPAPPESNPQTKPPLTRPNPSRPDETPIRP